MNRSFISLVKTLINVQYGISAFKDKYTKEKDKLWQPILVGLLMLLGFGILFSFYTTILMGIMQAGLTIGQTELVLVISVIIVQIVELITGIFTVMSAFYFAQDLSILIPIPFKPWQIVGAKFIGVMLSEYVLTIPLILPAVIIYATYINIGVMYWISSVIIMLTAPLLPLAIASLIVMVLMRFISATKGKEFFTALGTVFGVIISIGMQVIINRTNNMGTDSMEDMLNGSMDLVRTLSSAFPPASWAVNAMISEGMLAVGYMALFLGISSLVLAGVLALSETVFYKSVLASSEVSGRRQRLDRHQLSRAFGKKRSHTMALFMKEWKLFWRTPLFVTNGLMPFLIIPAAFLIPFMTSQDMSGITTLLDVPRGSLVFNLAIVGILLFVAASNPLTYTTFSREGRTFWMSLALPVDIKEQVNAKLLNCVAIIGVFLVFIICALSFIFHRSMVDAAIMILIAAPGIFAMACVSMTLDARMPRLDWNTPQELFKNNSAAGFTFILMFVPLFALVIAAILLVISGLSDTFVYIILAAIMIGMAVFAYNLLTDAARRLYKA
ncbi:putative ABC transporter permease subunit [Mahella australiensis]|uniref:ABC-2 type transport system permease protein n=1 Tax=Mahella australiensis (strain DSM 15567 / CIP 107919 / 50-1 BON) TaxID=697281 RepID=F3ZZ68_MAHA5|nr:hypothetical protein [Mahella australiensis]AEE97850.1 hypothetical protein Mahau_2714 [Mahella australiensis 50-1 BON]